MSLIPPQNIESEEAILGSLLLDNQAIERIDNLPISAFYVSAHRKIYDQILKAHASGQPFDLMFLSSSLKDSGQIESIGGIGKLAQLVDRTVSSANIDRHAKLVLEKWKRRELIASFQEAISEAYDTAIAFEEIQQKTETRITEIFSEKQTGGLIAISEILPQIWDELEKGIEPATPTGLNYLDQCLGGGFRPGELIVVAGRPGMGKTIAANFAARAISKTAPVAFFSCEMDARSIVRRFLATESDVNQSHLMANRFPENKASVLTESYANLSTLPIYVDDTPGSETSVNHIRSQCQKIYRKHGQMGLIIVDYLQLIGDQAATNRVNELGKYSAFLKGLSKKMQCPVIALSQLSRSVETRQDKRPVMSDLRDSGCVEQDADIILFLYRDEYYNPGTPDRGILEFLIRKNRHGPCGVAKAIFKAETGAITNFTKYQ
jgi:replicative DNA helicase